jgi:hypothetical protein
MHLGEDHRKAVEEGLSMFSYLMLSIGRPVYNPAPLPGFNTDQSYKHRRANADDVFSSSQARHNLKSSEVDQAVRYRDAGLMLSGNPEAVAEWLVEDAKAAGYGNLLVTFRVGNATHRQALKSQELFAKHVMPILRKINVDDTADASERSASRPVEVSTGAASGNGLPFYQDSNYTLNRDAVEVVGAARNSESGRLTVAWEMQVAKIAEDGSPTQIIVPGPTPDHRGCSIHLHAVTKEGVEISDDARVVLEANDPGGADPQIIFDGSYGQFTAAPEQAVPAQMRGVARNDYQIKLSFILPTGVAEPDLEHEESTFEIKCFKHLLTLSA